MFFKKAMDESWNAHDFLASLPIIYDITPEEDRGLRDLVVNCGSSHLRGFMGDIDLRAQLKLLFHAH